MLQGRVTEMATIVKDNQGLLVKLSATAMVLSTAVAKLYSFHRDTYIQTKLDEEYYEKLKLAYIESSEADAYYAEELSGVSAEVDKILLELKYEK